MKQATAGDTVTVHYEAKLSDGTVFDSTLEREPIEFIIGAGEVLPSFEKAVTGMHPSQSQTVHVSAERAFGPHREELVHTIDPGLFPNDFEPEVGQRLQIPRQDDKPIEVSVTAISESGVTLDANHPLAGRDLTFEIELVGVHEG